MGRRSFEPAQDNGEPVPAPRALLRPSVDSVPVSVRTALVGVAFLVLADGIRLWRLDDAAPYTWYCYLGVFVFSLLLGFVLDASLKGYGYVPGNGGTGETLGLDLRESRGFYWRS